MTPRPPWWWHVVTDFADRFGLAVLLVLVSVATAVLMVITATSRPLTPLEGVLFQLLVFGLGLTGSFLLGRTSAMKSAQDIIRPHARSAFRRVWTLYQSLSRLATRIQSFRDGSPVARGSDAQHALDVLEAMVVEQIGTGIDALEDWRDIIPEEVEELEARLLRRDETDDERLNDERS